MMQILTQSRQAAEMKTINDISGQIVDAAVQVHMRLGPGLLESVYERVLAYELKKRGLIVERQVAVPLQYDDLRFEEGFRADLVIEHQVLVELKSVEVLAPVHSKQVLTYLKLMNCHLGLLINFGAPLLKDGIKRIANNLYTKTSATPRLCVSHFLFCLHGQT
jgi:GxxExxY protein